MMLYCGWRNFPLLEFCHWSFYTPVSDLIQFKEVLFFINTIIWSSLGCSPWLQKTVSTQLLISLYPVQCDVTTQDIFFSDRHFSLFLSLSLLSFCSCQLVQKPSHFTKHNQHMDQDPRQRGCCPVLYFTLLYHLMIQLLFFWFTITTSTDVASDFLICSAFNWGFSAVGILTSRATSAVGVPPQGTMQSHC